jgi:single-stranded-DNA-specific exonuclease
LPQAEVELAASLTTSEWQGERALELRALTYRAPQMGEILPDDAGWAKPVPFQSTLNEVLESKTPVYVAPEGVAWFAARGVPVVPAEEAEVWFSLPESAVVHPGSVRVALSDKALGGLVPQVGKTHFRKVVASWERGLTPSEPWATVFDELGLRSPALAEGANLYASATYRQLSLRAALGRRLGMACRARSAEMFSEALERWWELAASRQEEGRVPATP